MSPEAFVFTAANAAAREHRARTIDAAVTIDEVGRYDRPSADALAAMGLERVNCWGAKPGPSNLRSWHRMEPGHFGLLYEGEGRFPLLLPVIYTGRSRALAEYLWGRDDDGQTWELMFYFGPGTTTDLTTDDIRAAFGYDEKWWPQGL